METTELLIAGRWSPSSDGATREIFNPASGEPIGLAAEATQTDVSDAVAAARDALHAEEWASLTPDVRGQILWRVAELIERDAEEIARIETLDQGQPMSMSRDVNIPLAAQVFRYYAGYATKLEGRVSQISIPDHLAYTRREPVGVVGIITPWNVPFAIAAWKMAPALVTGNSVVVKPSELTPLSTAWLARLCVEAGIPSGVVNLVTGGGQVGQALVSHPGVNKISFTGSTEVGQEIVRNSADDLKRVSLELGGKAPSIVTPGVDLDAVVQGNLQGALFNSGQACGAYTRFYVHESIAEQFTSKIATAAAGLSVGPGERPETFLGPLISKEHLDKVHSLVQSGTTEGASLITGGEQLGGELERGWFYKPTVFSDVTENMRIAREEIFGPVLSIFSYSDFDEAVERANDSAYGLASVVWTDDLRTAHRAGEKIRAGTVFVNQLPLLDPGAPWGGFGLSGWGREMGSYAIDAFTETKSIVVNLG